MAKRLENAAAKAVGLLGNFIGSMSMTSTTPTARPSKKPSKNRLMAGFYQTGSLRVNQDAPPIFQ
jgi:hypothetical protein